jgi:hypothetical protein
LTPVVPAAAAALLAAACRYACTNARPTTWEPTRMTWAISRWACKVRTERKIKRHHLSMYYERGRRGRVGVEMGMEMALSRAGERQEFSSFRFSRRRCGGVQNQICHLCCRFPTISDLSRFSWL